MLNSLKLYSKYFLKSAFSPERKFVVNDIKRYLMRKDVFGQEFDESDQIRDKALKKAIEWLLISQKMNADGGMGSYHLVNKWSASYPETTGYIIPTLIEYGTKTQNQEIIASALKAADFLLDIQKASGGWQGGRIGENRPEVVFNTGQVIRGMLAANNLTGDQKYLDSAVKAGDWLSSIIHEEGFWQTHALMNRARVYDTFVDAPLLRLYDKSGNERYKNIAIKNLNWVVGKKMHANGWFEDCDNTIKRNNKPILHTIAYTLDGLIESGLILKDDTYIKSAERGAVELRDLFLHQGFLHGRYDQNWKGSEYFLCTGGAQMASVWMKLFRKYDEGDYLLAARKMISLLILIQSRNFIENSNTIGAIPGSFPVWGRYEPFAFPNWATKFFCDALLLEKEIVR